MKIAVYSIAKNEAKNVEAWYEGVKKADYVFFLDTGSTDNTLEIIQGLAKQHSNIHVHTAEFHPFRFDTARNFLLEQVKKVDPDYAVFMDLDERFKEENTWYNNLKDFINRAHEPDAVNVRLIYSMDDKGEPVISYNRLMVHRPGRYRWKYPVHEVLVPDDSILHESFSSIEVVHHKDKEKTRNYGELLWLGYTEYGDARSAYYYAQHLVATEDYTSGVSLCSEAYQKESDCLIRSEICGLAGIACERLGDFSNAKLWFIRGLTEAPNIRESWANAANFYIRNKYFYSAIGCIENMLDVIEKPTHSIIRHDNLYAETPHHLLALCHEGLGDKEAAGVHINNAFDMQPQDVRIVSDMIRILGIQIQTKKE